MVRPKTLFIGFEAELSQILREFIMKCNCSLLARLTRCTLWGPPALKGSGARRRNNNKNVVNPNKSTEVSTALAAPAMPFEFKRRPVQPLADVNAVSTKYLAGREDSEKNALLSQCTYRGLHENVERKNSPRHGC